MRRTYHHFTRAADINKSLFAALRPGGRLAIIDFLSPRWLFFLRHGIPRNAVAREVVAAGFVLDRRIDRWSPIDYCLVFRKPPPAGIIWPAPAPRGAALAGLAWRLLALSGLDGGGFPAHNQAR